MLCGYLSISGCLGLPILYSDDMDIVLLHKHYDAAHLADVSATMQDLGAPTIRAVWSEVHGVWVALEGCHRLRAAQALGLTPAIDEVDYDSTTTTDDVGVDLEDAMTIDELVANAHQDAVVLRFEDAE